MGLRARLQLELSLQQAGWPFAREPQCDVDRSAASLGWGSHPKAGKHGFPGRKGRPEAQPDTCLPALFHVLSTHVQLSLRFQILLRKCSPLNTNQDSTYEYPRIEVGQAGLADLRPLPSQHLITLVRYPGQTPNNYRAVLAVLSLGAVRSQKGASSSSAFQGLSGEVTLAKQGLKGDQESKEGQIIQSF